MDERKEKLKKNVSSILLSAVNGLDRQYRTKQGYVQWGLVEKDIHQLIDDFEPSSSEIDVVNIPPPIS